MGILGILVLSGGRLQCYMKENIMDKNKENIGQQLDLAKKLIMTFIAEEYEEELRVFDYPDLGHIEVAYATTEDEEHEILIEISLINYSINQYIDRELVHSKKYESLGHLIEHELIYLEFSNLVCIDDELMEKFVGSSDLDKDGVVEH